MLYSIPVYASTANQDKGIYDSGQLGVLPTQAIALHEYGYLKPEELRKKKIKIVRFFVSRKERVVELFYADVWINHTISLS